MVEQDKKLMRHMWANIVILIVANVLSTDLYGCPADTYVMDGEGTTLGSSVRSGRTEAQSLADLADKLAEGQESRVWAALAEGERTRFSYEGDQGQSFGYVVPIGGTGWSVLQLFPSQGPAGPS